MIIKVVPDSLHLFVNVLLKEAVVLDTFYSNLDDALDSDDGSDDDKCLEKLPCLNSIGIYIAQNKVLISTSEVMSVKAPNLHFPGEA